MSGRGAAGLVETLPWGTVTVTSDVDVAVTAPGY
jgi:hypothetical protein